MCFAQESDVGQILFSSEGECLSSHSWNSERLMFKTVVKLLCTEKVHKQKAQRYSVLLIHWDSVIVPIKFQAFENPR